MVRKAKGRGKLRLVHRAKRDGKAVETSEAADPETALFQGLRAFVAGALERDPKLDPTTVLRAFMRFTASLGVTVAAELGGDAEQFALACEALFFQEQDARRAPKDSG